MPSTPITNDKVVHSFQVLETKNYAKFKILDANRNLDEKHAERLAKKIEREGNLTQYFPIIVNENLEVIDGQNRLKALETLEFPVFYTVVRGLTIDSVISLNTGHKNWTWQDFAESHAKRGNENYQKFLKLMEETSEKRFGVLYIYAALGMDSAITGGAASRSRRESFNYGDFEFKDFPRSLALLQRYYELSEVANCNMVEFADAAIRIMRTPDYNHESLIDAIVGHGGNLNHCYTIEAFYNELKRLQDM